MLVRVRTVSLVNLLALHSFLALALWPVIGAAQEAKLAALLERSPAAANAIAYFHAPSLKKLMSEAGMPLTINEKVSEVWLVSDLDTTSLNPSWEAGYATVDRQLSADSLAEMVSGYVDPVGDIKAVWTPRQSYLLPLEGRRVGFLRPARRTLLAKWINSTPGQTVAPEYLLSQAKQNENFLSLLIAVNLKDTFSSFALGNSLASFESLAAQDKQQVATTLSSVRGLSIIIGRRSLKECILSFEFGESPAKLVPFAGTLLGEILNRNGTSAPETATWNVSTEGNRLLFRGEISADSLDSILGIFSISGHAEQLTEQIEATQAAQSGRGSESQIAAASKVYFDKTNAYIERVRSYKAQNTGHRAKWNDKIARRIDELGTLNVDPQMIDYGSNVSSILRDNVMSIRRGNVSAGQMQAEQTRMGGFNNGMNVGFYGGFGGGFGGFGDANSIAMEQGVIASQQRMAGFGSFAQALGEVDKLTGEVRRAMTQKFQVQY